MTKKKVDELFFQLFCEKNSDGTKHLRLRGRELYQRIGRRLSKHEMPVLAKFLLKYPDIISVDLSYNDLGDRGIKILAEQFFENENNLKFIKLLHCDIHSKGMRALSSASHLNFRKIWLLGNPLGYGGAQYIGRLIEKCPNLEFLDVGETDQTLDSIESLLMVIEKSNLKEINISRIIPKSYYSQFNCSILADDLGVLLKMNTSLEVLRVQKCGFDGHDIDLLLSGLEVHKNLTMLDLGQNGIGDHGMERLAMWFKTRPALIVLRVPANNIGTLGAQALGLCLAFSRIRLLDVHSNRIEDQGLSDIFDGLKKSTQLRQFFMWGNKLGPLSLAKLERLLSCGILEKDDVDVRIYKVDGERYAAYNHVSKYKDRSYSIQEYGAVPELKIIRNKIDDPNAKPRALISFEYIDRYPPVKRHLGLSKNPCDEEKMLRKENGKI